MNPTHIPVKIVSAVTNPSSKKAANKQIEKLCIHDCYLYNFEGNNILYSPLDKLLLELDDDLKSNLSNTPTKEYWKQNIDPEGSLGLFRGQPPSVSDYIVENNYDGIVLLMNNLCNMGCSYCYAGDIQKQHTETIKEDLWSQIVDYAFNNLKPKVEEFTVGFHGYGECTIEFHKIVTITNLVTEYAKRFGINPKFSITTNGTFSEDECEWMINKGFRFNLSLDGPKPVNDLMRKSKGSKSFHHIIEKNVRQIAKNPDKCKLHLRATVTQDTTVAMVSSLEYFAELGVKSVQFEPFTPRGSAIELGAIRAANMGEFTSQMRECILRASELGVALRYGPLNFGIAVRFCSSESKLTVDYKGRILSCLQAGPDSGMDFFNYGSFKKNGKIEINSIQLIKLNSFSVYDNPTCQTCLLKYHCSGDCKAQDLDLAKNPGYKDNKCACNEELFAWTLKEIATGNRARSVLDFETYEI